MFVPLCWSEKPEIGDNPIAVLSPILDIPHGVLFYFTLFVCVTGCLFDIVTAYINT